MHTSSVQSAPCATSEAANDMLSGLLLQAGKGQKIEVFSTEVHEADGLWIATAFFKIEPLEEEDTLEADAKDEKDEKALSSERDPTGAVYWHNIHEEASEGQEPPPSRGIPESEEVHDINPEEYRAETLGVAEPPEQVQEEAAVAREPEAGEVYNQTIETAEDLQKDFEQAEQMPEQGTQIAYAPDTPRTRAEESFEERRARDKAEQERRDLEELERLRHEAVPLDVAEIPLETPEPSASP